jgi:hypothetical protein
MQYLYLNILQIGEREIPTVKYVDGLVLLDKEEIVLYGMLVGLETLLHRHECGEKNNENFDTVISWRS